MKTTCPECKGRKMKTKEIGLPIWAYNLGFCVEMIILFVFFLTKDEQTKIILALVILVWTIITSLDLVFVLFMENKK